jgi:hypothetical protein
MSEDGLKLESEELSDIDAIRDAVRIEQAQSRRVMLWFITVFMFVLLVVLALFLLAGIFLMRNSRDVVSALRDVNGRVAVNEFNVSSFTNELGEIRDAQLKLSAKLNASSAVHSREFGELSAGQRRHTKWIDVQSGLYEREKRNLNERLLKISTQIADNAREIERLSKNVDKFVSVGSVVVVPGKGSEAEGLKKSEPKSMDRETITPDQVNKIFEDALASVVVPERDRSKPETISVVTFPNEDRYEGEFKNGLMDGWGVYTFRNGGRYEGEFKNDMKQGRGILTTVTGERYVGEFKNGMRHGRGSLTMEDGERYIGDFNNDLMTGKGVMLYANGDKYAGDMVNGVRQGHGIMRFSNGDIYEGEFRDGKRTGSGKYLFADGSRYIGEFVDGVRQGMGRYVYTDGAEYIGPFEDGKKHREGVRVYSDGTRRKGLWRNDEFIRDIHE